MLSDIEIGWLAGFVDGEGSFGVNYDKRQVLWRPRCDIVNTDVKVMDYICGLLDRMKVAYSRHVKKTAFKPLHRIVILSQWSLEQFARDMRPFLIVKKEHCDVIIEMLMDNTFTNGELVTKLRLLNKCTGKDTANKDVERFRRLREGIGVPPRRSKGSAGIGRAR